MTKTASAAHAPACLFALLLIVGAAAGCRTELAPANPGPDAAVAANKGLELILELPGRNFTAGQTMAVTVTARNVGDSPIVMQTTGAPVYIRVYRHTTIGWDEVKRYPQNEIMVAGKWTLEPISQRVFNMNIPVEADWPTGEPLRIAAQLNGRGDVKPAVVVRVKSKPVN
jgi:hypothetical protein